jgi:hypothetical protein
MTNNRKGPHHTLNQPSKGGKTGRCYKVFINKGNRSLLYSAIDLKEAVVTRTSPAKGGRSLTDPATDLKGGCTKISSKEVTVTPTDPTAAASKGRGRCW